MLEVFAKNGDGKTNVSAKKRKSMGYVGAIERLPCLFEHRFPFLAAK